MHPDLGQGMIVMRAFALRDLILVMGEHQIDAAAMNVERLAQIFARHRRAFDVPSRASAAPGRIPTGQVRVRRLPQHEIHRAFLVGRDFDPRARDHLVQRTARQLAVIGLRRDIEQDMAIRHIGVAGGDQLPDHRHHLGDMIGRPRRHGGCKAAQRRDIFLIDAPGLFRQRADGLPTLGGAGVDLVVHVGDVADIGDMGIAEFTPQQPEQQVEHDRRARIADMGEVIDRRPAHIHAHARRIDRGEHPLLARQRIVEFQFHRRITFPEPAGRASMKSRSGEKTAAASVCASQ